MSYSVGNAMKRWRWVLLYLPLLVLLQLVVQFFLLHFSNPKGHSIKNRFIDTGYGFFSYKVGDDLCSVPETGELASSPSLVLQQADELLQHHKGLADILRGSRGRVGLPLSVHWVSRFAQLKPQGRKALQQRLRQLEDAQQDGVDGVHIELEGAATLDLSPELITAAFVYSQCNQKDKGAHADSADAREGGKNGPSSLGLSTQMFLPGRFLGDPQRICWGFRRGTTHTGEENGGDFCAPPLEIALQLVPLRLHRWWARVRWQYHWAEYVRKLLTVWWPLNPYMHMLYRQDMYAMLALMSPYLELEPPVPIDQSCRAPESYWVVPVSREKWELRRQLPLPHQLAGFGPLPASLANSTREPSDVSPGPSSSVAGGVLSTPEVHDNYVPIEEYCMHAREIHHGFFTGKPRNKPIKIVDAVILG